jgi:hypothetical protein
MDKQIIRKLADKAIKELQLPLTVLDVSNVGTHGNQVFVVFNESVPNLTIEPYPQTEEEALKELKQKLLTRPYRRE